jgi:hypothetical protein
MKRGISRLHKPMMRWHALPQGHDAAIIVGMVAGRAQVVLEPEPCGERLPDELEDDPLPRICSVQLRQAAFIASRSAKIHKQKALLID